MGLKELGLNLTLPLTLHVAPGRQARKKRKRLFQSKGTCQLLPRGGTANRDGPRRVSSGLEREHSGVHKGSRSPSAGPTQNYQSVSRHRATHRSRSSAPDSLVPSLSHSSRKEANRGHMGHLSASAPGSAAPPRSSRRTFVTSLGPGMLAHSESPLPAPTSVFP